EIEASPSMILDVLHDALFIDVIGQVVYHGVNRGRHTSQNVGEYAGMLAQEFREVFGDAINERFLLLGSRNEGNTRLPHQLLELAGRYLADLIEEFIFLQALSHRFWAGNAEA